MFGNPSLITRIAVGKAVGLIFGLIGLVWLTVYMPDTGWMMRWGVLLWYVTLGAIIGMFGVMTRHPVLKLPMPWWLRAPLLGGWMNFVLTLFNYDQFKAMTVALVGADSLFSSPFWFVAEGAIIGLIIGYCATRFGGEGRDTVAA